MRIYPILVWLLTAGIFALDVAAGKELNFWFIYLLPVCLAAGARGLGAGCLLAFTCTGMLFAARLIVGNPFSSEWIFVINRLGCGFALLVSAILVALLRQQYRTNLAPLGTDTVMRIE